MSKFDLQKGITKGSKVMWFACGAYWHGIVIMVMDNPNGYTGYKVVVDGSTKSQAGWHDENDLELVK